MKKKQLAIIAVLITLVSGGGYCMTKWIEHQNSPYNVSDVLDDKGVKLYKRGFRLLEEQLATYIKEHYSGVSKIEFSPIFVQGGDGQAMFSANIVFSIYDKNQNKAYVGGTIGDITYPTYDNVWDVRMDFNGWDEEIIELRTSDKKLIDVSDFQHLPPEAKLKVSDKVDENLKALIKDKQIEGIKKDAKGSADSDVVYNDEIKKGDEREWR
ncbi:hypothetical protein [Streptococcus cristatus]|uniref:hypothetical protein n=1 Tax=Streptococcus cristatus TaxID=45634 RepID=UPI002283EB72|nr:hypothetical protein [Streptococcus cristatus]MCY7217048.1 hypothetical protein [Streptococcus cristatus]